MLYSVSYYKDISNFFWKKNNTLKAQCNLVSQDKYRLYRAME